MKVIYLDDLHIPSLGDWRSEAAGDWLHPLHGPLPDHLGLLECCEQEFMAALWETPRTLEVMIEQLRHEDTDPYTPMRTIDDVYTMRGWIIQTYQWTVTPEGVTYGGHKIIPDEYNNEAEWRENIYRSVLAETVKICANFPGG